jgi:hypothetical protein
MRIVTNQPLVKKRARLGRIATLGGFAALIGGLVYSTFGVGAQDSTTIAISYAALIAGYLLISLGKSYWLRFSVRPRPDEQLANHLKTLDVRHVLVNYISAVPVDHLMLTGSGAIVIETRPFVGDIVVRGEKWSRRRGILGWMQFLSEGALGNPSRDAIRGVDEVKTYLAERIGTEAAAQVPILPLVVFTHPRVTLTVEDPTVPVCHARDARDVVRKIESGAPKLSGELARKIEAAVLKDAAPEAEPVSATVAIERERRARRRPTRAR